MLINLTITYASERRRLSLLFMLHVTVSMITNDTVHCNVNKRINFSCQCDTYLLFNRSGNQYVRLVVVTPTSLTEEQVDLLKKFSALEGSKVQDERSWTSKFSLDLDKAWSRLKSFTGQAKQTNKKSSSS